MASLRPAALAPLASLWPLSPLAVALCLLCDCGPRLPPPVFPGHDAMFAQAEYTHGASAVPYSGRLATNDGLVAYLKELDDHLLLLRQLLQARARLQRWPVPDGAPERYHQRLADERARVAAELDQLGPLIRQFLDLGAARRSFAIIPELREAIRLSRTYAATAALPALPARVLHDYLLLLGSAEAACGAEQPDPLRDPERLPVWYTTAQKAIEDSESGALKLSPDLEARHRRLLAASPAQRRAVALYGPYRRIAAAPAGRPGELWTFQIGSVAGHERASAALAGGSPGGSLRVDDRPRALVAECEYDPKGRLRAARDEVIDRSGQPVDLSRAPLP